MVFYISAQATFLPMAFYVMILPIYTRVLRIHFTATSERDIIVASPCAVTPTLYTYTIYISAITYVRFTFSSVQFCKYTHVHVNIFI